MNPTLSRIMDAMEFLWGIQNSDGGIPATKRGDPSGCWTTAMTVEAHINSVLFPLRYLRNVEKASAFLIVSQLPSGGWPVVIGGATASTMATSQTIAALHNVSKLAEALAAIDSGKLSKAIEDGKAWLLKHQDQSGGWGVEPDATAGQQPRIIATFYAAQAISSILGSGDTASSPALKRAIEWLGRSQLDSGAWPDQPGGISSLGSTARVLSLLARIQDPGRKSMMRRGLGYLKSQRRTWALGTETYVAKGASGQTRFHFNLLCDIGHALQDTQERWGTRNLHSIASRALAAQNDDGSWPLFDFANRDTEICTWSTSEWLDFFLKRFTINPAYLSDTLLAYARMLRINRALRATVAILILIILVWPLSNLATSILAVANKIEPTLSPSTKLLLALFVFVVPTIVLGILANLVSPAVARAWSRLRGGDK